MNLELTMLEAIGNIFIALAIVSGAVLFTAVNANYQPGPTNIEPDDSSEDDHA